MAVHNNIAAIGIHISLHLAEPDPRSSHFESRYSPLASVPSWEEN